MTIVYTKSVLIDSVDTNLTAQITTTGSVTVVGSDIKSNDGFLIRRSPSANNSTVWVFGTGSGSSTGFPLTDNFAFLPVSNLNLVSFSGSATSAEVVCVIKA